ncbi:MAG: 4-oxalomesaconate tautomerase [Proteobacteria bacterium]|nr:4-oxalomesaconate tautomerase [Pseudomonadota bacterium]
MLPMTIPCALMRGGTSRGPVFLASDLPERIDERDAALIAALGAGHELQVDGIGGGNPLTSKVAIVGPPTKAGADVDYLFAQVKVRERAVDTSPNCGNMLATVGPFAIERGLVPATDGITLVRIHNVNTGKIIEARIDTPNGKVCYEGSTHIDGVPGTAAPVRLAFLNAAGAKTGKLLPSGKPSEEIDGIPVTLIDAAMPLVVIPASAMGKTGHETPADLDADKTFMRWLEVIRREAGRRMGLGDVSGLVIPKPVLIAEPQFGGTFSARYFMPHECHKALAVTGAVGLATAAATQGTLVHALSGIAAPSRVVIEHPSGKLELGIDPGADGAPVVSVIRTARLIFDGYLHLPTALAA